MRRWVAALALGAVAGAGLTACGRPAGVDGKLADDWPAFTAPTSFTPAAATCYSTDFAETALRAVSQPVDCAGDHRTETVHVGTFTGAAANAAKVPGRDSNETRAAFAECDGKAASYLGADWRFGRLWLGVALPSDKAWAGGSRWYRCDVTEKANIEENGETVVRKGSLKGALAEASPLRLGCYDIKVRANATIEKMTTADCAKEHNGEFVGVWQAGKAVYPVDQREWVLFYTGCRKVIADYVKLPVDTALNARSGVAPVLANKKDWLAGNRGARCYVWLEDRTIKKSLKGAGPNALPDE